MEPTFSSRDNSTLHSSMPLKSSSIVLSASLYRTAYFVFLDTSSCSRFILIVKSRPLSRLKQMIMKGPFISLESQLFYGYCLFWLFVILMSNLPTQVGRPGTVQWGPLKRTILCQDFNSPILRFGLGREPLYPPLFMANTGIPIDDLAINLNEVNTMPGCGFVSPEKVGH